jgi:BirA family biotin operon repressor/biotin-[acetyl-CoA-carboxylase] ligase
MGGILSELIVNESVYSIVGVGLNLNFRKELLPLELQQTATTTLSELEIEYDVEDITCKIALAFFNTLDRIEADSSITSILDTWRNLNCTLGRDVMIETDDQHFNGKAMDITENGFLIVKMPSGKLMEVQAGDVIHLKQPVSKN